MKQRLYYYWAKNILWIITIMAVAASKAHAIPPALPSSDKTFSLLELGMQGACIIIVFGGVLLTLWLSNAGITAMLARKFKRRKHYKLARPGPK